MSLDSHVSLPHVRKQKCQTSNSCIHEAIYEIFKNEEKKNLKKNYVENIGDVPGPIL